MNQIAIVALALLLLPAVCSAAAVEVPKGFLMKSVPIDGKQVKYAVYVPPDYDPAKPIPTILFLHGMGESGTDGLKQIAVGIGHVVMFGVDKWPFLIIFPQKPTAESAWEEHDAMVMAILEQTKKDYNVDSSRLYLTGLSQGGHGAWTIGARHPDLFAAIAPICGWCEKPDADKLAKVPIWCFHGEDDETVKIDNAREICEYLKGLGALAKFTAYPGVGHNSWDKAYREENLGAWFLEHHR